MSEGFVDHEARPANGRLREGLSRLAYALAFATIFGTAYGVGLRVEPPSGATPARDATRERAGDARTRTAQDAATLDIAALDRVDEACWSEVRTWRVYFAHQSVGSDIVRGLQETMRRKPALGLVLAAYAEPDTSDGATHTAFDAPAIIEGNAGKRGHPERKIEEFAKLLRSPEGARIDIAILKLCYGDIGRTTDVEKLADTYIKTVEAITRDHPHIRFLHCTVPLKAEEHGAKGRMKRLVGAGSDASNSARSRYNELIRKRFPVEQVFDVARIESTGLDGKVATVEYDGQMVQTLADEYTEDGAHLNALGQAVLAREFLVTLANQCSAKAKGVATGSSDAARAEPEPGNR
jgi:hypothetical protein